jgi:hypothetical protein
MREMKNALKILVGKLEGKTPLGRPRYKWEGNIKMGCRELGFGRGGLDLYGSG